MKTTSCSQGTFAQNVQKAYAQFNQADYTDDLDPGAVPPKAMAALDAFSGKDPAEYAEKLVCGKPTYAAYVPSTDSGDIEVVGESGKVLAKGTYQDGNPSIDWNKS